MSRAGWRQVPVGGQADRWSTFDAERTVLAVARTVTSTGRLLDVLPVLGSDPRIQVVFTAVAGSAFDHGVADLLHDVQATVLPWSQAIRTRFQLAISASANGPLHRLRAPLLLMPHGAGHNRQLPGLDGVSGLSRGQLTHRGRVVPAAIALSHHEQLAMLARDCPQAVDRAVVVGDPCFDRIVAHRTRRPHYRRLFGVADGRRLVVVTSTWNSGSTVGAGLQPVLRLVSELPMDSYRVALIMHPNIWDGHGGFEIRRRLAQARAGGLILVPPTHGWQAALLAADVIIGDHGSVTFYGAGLGIPTILAATGTEELDPASPTRELVGALPRLDPAGGLRDQLESAIAGRAPDRQQAITARTLGAPGLSAERLRELMYRLMELEPPGGPARAEPLRDPEPERQQVTSFRVTAELTGTRLLLERFPTAEGPLGDDPHLVVDLAEIDLRLRESADVLVGAEPADVRELLAHYPGCSVVAAPTGPSSAVIAVRGGPVLDVHGVTADVAASVVHAWRVARRPLDELRAGVTVSCGHRTCRIWSPPPG